jgi:signal transduction histidine kinase
VEPAPSGTLERLAPWTLGAAVFLACFFTPQESPLLTFQPGAGRQYLGIQGILDPGTNPWAFLVVAFLSALAAVRVRRTRWPLYVMAAAAWLLFALWPVPFVATYSTLLRFKRRRDLVWYLVAACAVIGLPFVVGNNFSSLPSRERTYAFGLFISITIVIPTFAGLWIRARRQKIEALVERHARLQSEQEARQDQARTEERNRIARDMHDVVANRIAMMVMHAGALQLGTHQENEVRKGAALITALGRTALTELRDVLGVLRKSAGEEGVAAAEEPLPSRLEKLAEEVRAAGLQVEYRVMGKTLEALPDAARIARERAVYRVAQEALTNVMKHARGASTVMTLQRSTTCLEITVENEPPSGWRPPAMPLPSSGLGQVGMRERVTVLNGEFEARTRPDGGYVVHAVLPN